MKLSALNPAYHGSADAHVAVQRASGRFAGDVDAKVHGFALDPTGKNTLDGTAKITAKDGKLVAAIQRDQPARPARRRSTSTSTVRATWATSPRGRR